MLAALLLAVKVVVVPYAPLPGVPDAAAARATELLTQDLSSRSDVQLVEPPRKVVRPADDAPAQIRAALAKASELARKDRHAESAEQLAKAISVMQAHPALLDEALGQQMIDAALQLAVEREMAGDEDGGDAALSQLVRLAPERNVEKSDFPPAFSMALSSMKKRMLGEPRGALRILAPPGAGEVRAVIDGKPLRAPPVVVEALIPGEHFVRVERSGLAWGGKVVVIAGVETKLAPVDDALVRALLEGELDRGAVQEASQRARDAGADAALFGALVKQGDGVRVRTFLVRADKVAPLVALDMDRELLGGLVQMVKVGDDASAKLASPSLAEPPLPLSLEAAPVGAVPNPLPVPAATRPAPEPPSRALVIPRMPTADDDAPAPIAQAKSPVVPAKTTQRLQALEPEQVKTVREEPPRKSHTALWIAAGVIVAGGLAAGGFLLYEAGRTPTTATVTTTWGH